MYQIEPITEAPSKKELFGRLEKVRELMAKEGLDFYISTDPVNVYYLTNFFNYVHERPFILVIPMDGNPKFVVPYLEEAHVLSRAVSPLEIVRYFEYPAPEGESWHDQYRELIPNNTRVGVESAMTLRIYRRTPGEITQTDIIDEIRIIKTPYEIGRTVHTCNVMSKGMEQLLKISRPGTTFLEIQGTIGKLMNDMVLKDIPEFNFLATKFWAFVQPPPISDDPHNFTNVYMEVVEGGPHVSLVLGQSNGYGAEVERTFFLGAIPEMAKKPFDAMMAARSLAFDLAKPGQHMGELDMAVRGALEKHGYGDRIMHRTGHGLGITGHEAPYLAVGYDRVLEPGMLISIEPGIYIPGLGGFRHSDSILITEEGPVTLTKGPDTQSELTFSL